MTTDKVGEGKPLAWTGEPPTDCDVCGRTLSLSGTFIDGKTRQGPWATMCIHCHSALGVGLGTGKGQKYTFDKKTGTWR